MNVVEGDELPEYELEVLMEIAKRVALRLLKKQADSVKFDLATSPANL